MQIKLNHQHHRKSQPQPGQLVNLNKSLESEVAKYSRMNGKERAQFLRRFERQFMEIRSAERREVGYELHDSLGPHLTGIAFKVKLLEETLAGVSPELARSAREVVSLVNAGIDQVRRLAEGLDTTEIEAGGLSCALKQLADHTSAVFQISCLFRCERAEPRFDPAANLQLYRIAQEAVHNALKHAGTKSIVIELAVSKGKVALVIADDGRGFSDAAIANGGLGLRTMEHRARSIGGSLIIESKINHGTRITCDVRPSRLVGEPVGRAATLAIYRPIQNSPPGDSRSSDRK